MNQYLLLRDNKQSGPYTMEELVAKGLKAYDLVWVEGKSAAWRYPSEIAELKPYAPVVEEQPYDRFYKKNQEESHPALDRARRAALAAAKKERAAVFNTVTEAEPVQQRVQDFARQEETAAEKLQEQKPVVQPKKIYVTLPASAGKVLNEESKKPVTTFSESINTIAEERPAVKKQEEPAPVVVLNESITHNTTGKDLYTQLQENERAKASARQPRTMRPVMMALTAACILLFGVIIGLYISNMKQRSQSKELEALVKRIQEREKNRNNTPATLPAQVPQQIVEEMKQAIDSSNAAKEEPASEQKLHISTVSRKGNTPPEVKQQVAGNNTPATIENKEPIVSNAVVKEEEPKDKISYQQAALEAARKNIHQMLLVENSDYKTGLLGGISNLFMTLSNNSRYPLDQVEIEIKYYGPEQKLVRTQTLVFNDLAPGEQKTLEAPRTNRGISIDYAITRIQSKVLGLAQNRF